MRESPERQKQVREWVRSAICDRWFHRLYSNVCTLEREGFKARVLMRDATGPPGFTEYSIHAWGPDGASISVACPYDWAQILAEPFRCPQCNATGVDTVRVAFADRACVKCAPALRAKLETPGWSN